MIEITIWLFVYYVITATCMAYIDIKLLEDNKDYKYWNITKIYAIIGIVSIIIFGLFESGIISNLLCCNC